MQDRLARDNINLPLNVGVNQLRAFPEDKMKKIWALSKDKKLQLPAVSTRHAALACTFGALLVSMCLGVVRSREVVWMRGPF